MSYKDLEIYKLAFKLSVEVHNMTMPLPKFELYEEGSQIRRSSKSVGSNIAEGYGKRQYKKSFNKKIIMHLNHSSFIIHLES